MRCLVESLDYTHGNPDSRNIYFDHWLEIRTDQDISYAPKP